MAIALPLGASASTTAAREHRQAVDHPTLHVVPFSTRLSRRATSQLELFVPWGAGEMARVVVFVPAGYRVDLTSPPGAEVGLVVAWMEIGGYIGKVIADAPAAHVTNSCAPGLHEAIWLMELNVQSPEAPRADVRGPDRGCRGPARWLQASGLPSSFARARHANLDARARLGQADEPVGCRGLHVARLRHALRRGRSGREPDVRAQIDRAASHDPHARWALRPAPQARSPDGPVRLTGVRRLRHARRAQRQAGAVLRAPHVGQDTCRRPLHVPAEDSRQDDVRGSDARDCRVRGELRRSGRVSQRDVRVGVEPQRDGRTLWTLASAP